LNCIFRVFPVSQNSAGHSYEFWARGHKHLLKGFRFLAMCLSLNGASGLVAYGSARGWRPVPFSSSENRQGLAELCCCAVAPTESRGCKCVGHSALSFPPCCMKQLRVQRGTNRRRINHLHCFQQKGDTRPARPYRTIPIAGYSCRGFDNNVEAVTELRALEYLVLLCGARLVDESHRGGREKDSRGRERL
jgi:hypothetical protein